MSIFNVGAGREPAEIGVAEYQKPDYQQFEKLANINMALKEHELEKAQKKTKEWGDILNTDYSTKYGVEQANIVQKGLGDIRNYVVGEVKKDPSFLDNPAKMLEVKAKMNQIGGLVKALDMQAENIMKEKKEYEEDVTGKKFDKTYADDYFKAQDDPFEFVKNNPNSEVSKILQTIIDSPQIQAITDPSYKRVAVRSALQGISLKRGVIAINTNPTMPKLGHDDVLYESTNGASKGFDVVSRPKIISSLMGYAKGMTDKESNTTFEDAWKAKMIQTYGDENTALTQAKDRYIQDYDAMQKQYGNNPKIEGLKDLPSPDKITPEELIRYDFANNYASQYTDRKEHNTTPRNIVNIHNGDGTPKTTGSISAINVMRTPKYGGGYDEIAIPTTVIIPRKKTTVTLSTVYGMGADGSLFDFQSSGLNTNVKASMEDTQLLSVPVYNDGAKEHKWKNPTTKSVHRLPLTKADQEDMILHPENWRGKVKFVTIITGTNITTQHGIKKVDNSFGYANENQTAFDAIKAEAKAQNYKGTIPEKVEYDFDEGLKFYKQLNAPKPF